MTGVDVSSVRNYNADGMLLGWRGGQAVFYLPLQSCGFTFIESSGNCRTTNHPNSLPPESPDAKQ
jgi:hypothetical protein